MEDLKVISGSTEDEIWRVIEADFANSEIFTYQILIRQGDIASQLYMDIDPGGGFEGGSEITSLKAPLILTSDFKFALHDQDFLDTIGKFFGMPDIEIGYPALDDHLIIKTNSKEKVRKIFADADLRVLFTSLCSFDFGIHTQKADNSNVEQPFLELNINEGINESEPLRKVYHAFYTLINAIQDADRQ